MLFRASAKINLFLHVGDKRPDGFHALESLVAFTEAGDVLDFAAAENLSLDLAGPFADKLSAEPDNLVLRAARKLAERGGIEPRARITLTKNLPVASGIGGGSADAAATLNGLNALWKPSLPGDVLHSIAAELGSDIPVCVESRPAWMEGRGERVTPLEFLPAMPAVLVNPGVAVTTAKVFAALEKRRGTEGLRPQSALTTLQDVLSFLQDTTNDLEAPALKVAPVIADVLFKLKAQANVRLARMSGSGATCFGLFDDTTSAQNAAQAIATRHPQWWVQSTVLLGTV